MAISEMDLQRTIQKTMAEVEEKGRERAVNYLRVSDPRRQGGERNVSLITQRARFSAHCSARLRGGR